MAALLWTLLLLAPTTTLEDGAGESPIMCTMTADMPPSALDCDFLGPGVHCSPVQGATNLGAECQLTHVTCTAAMWGVHSWPATVGGRSGCHVLVEADSAAFANLVG